MANRRDPYRRYEQPHPSREDIRLENIAVNPGYQEENAHYGAAHPAYNDSGAAMQLDRRDSDASSYHSEQDSGPRRRWVKDETPRDTAILLEHLPSKQFEKLASDVGRAPTRKGSRHQSIRVPRGATDSVADMVDAIGNDSDFDDEQIKEMTMTLSRKRRLKSQLSLKRKAKPTRVKYLKYSWSIGWRHFKYKLAEFAYFLKLWRGHLKKIEGHFGTGVLSYFLFLKWLFFINMPIFFFTFGFVILPQILHRWEVQSPPGYTQNISFTGRELLTGSYWFTDTEMYYGFYTEKTFSLVEGTWYNMKYAYLFTCGGYYILCLIILALSISKSYKKNYIEGSGTFNFYYVSRVFCGWDYGITAEDAAKLKQKSIANEMKEYLSGVVDQDDETTFTHTCKWFLIRVFTNVNVLAMIGASGYLIYYISTTQSVAVDIPVLSEMAMPLCVSGINLILPFIFSLIGRIENYKKPRNELYINMARTMLLKAVTLAVLVYFWYQVLQNPCWETFVGQEIYRLVIVDFIFVLLTTFFVEFVRRLMVQHCCKSLQMPEFEIGRNTLNLIYSQALCWLGTYFCPMLSLVMIIKLFIIFYIKRFSVIMNCKPSLRAWRAARSHTIFLFFLFLFFLMATAAVACAVIFVKPSDGCGPFKNHTTSYEVVELLVDSWKVEYEVLHTIVRIISSSGFIAGAIVVLCVLTYYMRIVMVGHKEMVNLLRQQLSMEGRDKAYLLKMLQDASKKHKSRPSNTSRLLSPTLDASSTLNSTAPGGRQFIKQLAQTKENTAEATPTHRKRNTNGLRMTEM